MGIKGAFASGALGLLLMGTALPLHAQDDPDRVAPSQDSTDRADAPGSADPSELDRSPADSTALDDSDERAATRSKPVRRTSLGARALDSDSDDSSDVDRDGVDKDQGDDEGAPKADRAGKKDAPNKDAANKDKSASNKDAAKKEPAKKDAEKSAAAAKTKGKEKPGGCVDVTAEARFASVGYDHIVTLKSECKKLMKCVVRTNVSPDPASVALAPRAEESVVMWRGSPARVFTPEVTCD